jgi:Raf kinase inhibitor-like YbhB/YbcL family protein
MKIQITSFENGTKVTNKHSFCILNPDGTISMGQNINPEVSWSDFPKNTKSFALICVDPDVPSVGDDVNQEGKRVHIDLPRVDFYHWVVANIPVNITKIKEGAASNGITPRGKHTGVCNYGGVQGVNDYTGWYDGDMEMEGVYGGYDGPCPPWNDERIHHYHFKIYALDIEKLEFHNHNFTGRELEDMISGHIIEQAEWIGTYTLNKELINTIK